MFNKMGRYLTIDPGMFTGWACWSYGSLHGSGEIKTKKVSLAEDLKSLGSQLWDVIKYQDPSGLCIEFPEVWQGSEASMASSFSGDLLKLSAICGMYAGIAVEKNLLIKFVLPREWKGNWSKDLVKEKIERALGFSTASSHTNDAIGIGLFLQGKLLLENPTKNPFGSGAENE